MARWTPDRSYNGYRTNPSRPWRTNIVSHPQTPELPFGALKSTITASQVASLITEKHIAEAKIEQVQYVSSYNLHKEATNATIVVPGQPPRWTPSQLPTLLGEDRGEYYRDRNAAKFPQHPMAPAVAACLTSSPTLFADGDIFACASTLGNLLRFVRREKNKCRMLVEKCGRAVFLIRRENSPTERIPNVRGYGHTFPEAFTTWDHNVRDSDSHQRMISYRFGGLKLIVRSKADGYFASDTDVNEISPGVSHDGPEVDIDALTAELRDTAPLSNQQGSANEADIVVREAGRAPSQSQIFDIKTRSHKRADEDHVAGELPRLWIAQIPRFVLAYHNHGLFRTQTIEEKDVRGRVQAWEFAHQEDLTGLAALLHRVVETCNEATEGNTKMEILIENETLRMHEQMDGVPAVLPADLKARWEAMDAKPTEDAPNTNAEAEKAEAA